MSVSEKISLWKASTSHIRHRAIFWAKILGKRCILYAVKYGNLLIYPQSRFSHNSNPFLVKVTPEQSLCLPIINHMKKERIFRRESILTSYDWVDAPSPNQVHETHQIHNDLPQNNRVKQKGSQAKRLNELIKRQNWSHLEWADQAELRQIIIDNHPLVILDEEELGLMSSPSWTHQKMLKIWKTETLSNTQRQPGYPIVLVSKPDGSKGMCLDYQHVNKHLASDIYLLLWLNELVEQAVGHKYYATLDMCEACFQISLDEKSRDLTTLSDGVALYQFKRLPLGLNCSPAIFLRCMTSLLTPLLWKGWVKNYLDDLTMFAPTFSELLTHFEELFSLLMNNRVKLNLSKCAFRFKEVTFLRHHISAEGSKPNPKKFWGGDQNEGPYQHTRNTYISGNVRFLSETHSYFTKEAATLLNLTKFKVLFIWMAECQKVFELLKSCLTNAAVLVKPLTDNPFVLTTNVSNTYEGNVLSQHFSYIDPF